MQVMVTTFRCMQSKAQHEVSSELAPGLETGVRKASLQSLPHCSTTNADTEHNFIEKEADDR